VFIGDVGDAAWEEIDDGPPGANFGWPLHEGPENPPDSTTVDPLFAYAHDPGSAAVVGNIFYVGTNFPSEYEGNFFFFDHTRGTLGRMVLSTGNTIASIDTAWAEVAARGNGYGPVDLQVGPDGALYYTTYIPGQLRRISYSGGDNRRPSAAAKALGATNGYVPLETAFSGEDSYDVDGDSLVYEWSFGDGTPPATEQSPSHTYAFNGVFPVRLVVRDGRGGESISEPIFVTVGNLGPIVEIATPLTGALFLDDQEVSFSGSAVDPEFGALPPSSLHWRVLLHHLSHVHPTIVDQVGEGGSFIASFHHEEPQNIYYSITAWAVDVAGLRSERSVFVYPDPQAPGGVMRVLNVPADDRDAVCVAGEVRTGGFNSGKPFDYASNDADSMHSAVQFAVDLSPGATILEASLLFTAGPLQSPSVGGGLEIRAYDVADAAPFTNGPGDLSMQHPLSAATIEWKPPIDWVDGVEAASPDLTALVQAFVDRADYVPGQHLGFVITKGTIESGAYYSWTDYASLAPPTRLRLRYELPTGVGEEAPRARFALRPNVPNPFNPTTRIEFSLAEPGRAQLEILDVRGRLLRVLYDGQAVAGSHAQLWDGCDDHGFAVASGVYLCRLRAGARSESRRLVLVR
jgi:PKD repeat protein